ncbi:transcriptional repressor [Paracoccus versutus]|uniref:Fur family iron response transcriptional regulator n=1 Tax=Paracoccus versutus TaxID=34007 RepID=A0AAQ0KKC5_PARVE|nr:Fur family transcriptional regulator [Paracoccus versutus]REG38963.1 Fur family iron response transcriptional regulator [Paracoccus versutus]WEJ79707.1 transcriptional repressor [Paracoccus versutus]
MTASDDSPFGSHRARSILAEAGLQATRQRLAIVDILSGQPPRHVSAEDLFDALQSRGAPGSLSRVYGSLKRFCETGLVRRVPAYGNTVWYEMKGEDHHHFYIEEEDRLLDIPAGMIHLAELPPAPPGYELAGIDVLCRIRRTASEAGPGASRGAQTR